jgi:uncharacterized DUF497 family protein
MRFPLSGSVSSCCYLPLWLLLRQEPSKPCLEDDFALTREEPDSEGEQRFVTLGVSSVANLLVVVYTYREPEVIRIISAWRANRRQRLCYEKDRR